mmetsp:Transcript_68628/g.107313  ORF Transcript_68628/g.107313 Transcript_68628/m.107313 type:complete len:406 (+) Transcript_68628:77-1294(+)
MIVNTGLILFLGLFVLFLWRQIFWWRICGTFLRRFNYIVLMLVLVCLIMVYDCYRFWLAFRSSSSGTWIETPVWLKVTTYGSVILLWPIFCLSSYLIYQHIECIKGEAAVLWHDRALQIVILPLVFAAMCMSCLTECYTFMIHDTSPEINAKMEDMLASAETCMWIADLYEAWALYQFGVLTIEILKQLWLKQGYSKDQAARSSGLALLQAHPAVERLAWMGILSFVLVSVADVAVALFFLTIGHRTPDFVGKFNSAEADFDVAGFLASCTAIYNVYVLEHQFHHTLEEFCPFLKFLTVKILVTFAYGQQYFFEFLQVMNSLFPTWVQNIVAGIPVLSTLTDCSQALFYTFYAGLMIIECFFIALAHIYAWPSAEAWYDEAMRPIEDESEPMLKGPVAVYGTTKV